MTCQLVGFAQTLSSDPLPLTAHILTLTPFYPRTGDEANGCFVSEPLSALRQLGIEPTVIAVQPFYRGPVEAGVSAPSAHWVRFAPLPSGFGLPSSGAFLHSRIVRHIRRLHVANPIHLIHAHGALPCGHAAMLLSRELGIPFAVTVHGLDAFSTNQVKGLFGRWCRRVSQHVYTSASAVICISVHVQEQVLEGAPNANTTVVYNGVDPQLFSPAPTPASSGAILSVGNLIAIKGHKLLLRAIAALPERANLSCIIIGEGPERERLIALAHQLNLAPQVRFLGRQGRAQVAEAMGRCTLFALPSRYEGLGCAYLEAMSAAKPVVACRGQGIEELIQDGVNGCLVPPNDAAALSGTMSLLLENPQRRQQLGAAARHTVLQRLTLFHQAERLAQIYRECMA